VHPDVELERVFESTNPALVAMAKSLLDAAGIEYVTSGEGTQIEFGAIPVRIQVKKEKHAEAKALLEDLEATRLTSVEGEPGPGEVT
jgi:hypothetical protein